MFPLYETLKSVTVRDDIRLSDDDKKQLAVNIKKMGVHEHELIYAIIRTHQLYKYNHTSSNFFPFDAKIIKTGIQYDMNNFDSELQLILYTFAKQYQKNLSSSSVSSSESDSSVQ